VYLIEQMLWHIANVVDLVDRWIFVSHSNDLVVSFTLVDHGQNTNHLSFDERQWLDFYTTQDQYVERIFVVTIGLRDETIVRWIVHRSI
jgi:hypothetical protein